MPVYQFECKKCGVTYDRLLKYDEKGKYPGVKCPDCGSKKKKQLLHSFAFSFTNPVGTDRWNGSHDYRFKHKLPTALGEREAATKAASSKTGFTSARPYNKIDDVSGGKNFGEVK
jgi:putative FmdB family regulatory protein